MLRELERDYKSIQSIGGIADYAHMILFPRAFNLSGHGAGGSKMAKKSKLPLSFGAALASLSGLSMQGAEVKPAVGNDYVTSPVDQACTRSPHRMLTFKLVRTSSGSL